MNAKLYLVCDRTSRGWGALTPEDYAARLGAQMAECSVCGETLSTSGQAVMVARGRGRNLNGFLVKTGVAHQTCAWDLPTVRA